MQYVSRSSSAFVQVESSLVFDLDGGNGRMVFTVRSSDAIFSKLHIWCFPSEVGPRDQHRKNPSCLVAWPTLDQMASKLVLLPTLLLALAFVTFCAPSFVFGGRPAPTSSLRSTARAAVPEALELQTSMTTALEVSTPGWWANIVLVVVPCAILIILYLQSEKRKYENKMGKK